MTDNSCPIPVVTQKVGAAGTSVSTLDATKDLFRAAAKVPARIAPEKMEKLSSELTDWPWKLATAKGEANFYAEVDIKKVKLSNSGLAALWNIAFVAFTVADAGTRARLKEQTERGDCKCPSSQLDITSVWEAQRLDVHMSYAKSLMAADLPWPLEIPMPSANHCKVQELCLGALGWLMMHEIGHIIRNHDGNAVPARRISQEHEADEFATEWVLGEAGNGLEREFRILAVSVAMAFLLLAKGAKGASATHPASYQRVLRTIRHYCAGKRSVGLESSAYFLKAMFLPHDDQPEPKDAADAFEWVISQLGNIFPAN